jgi:predicted transcriptional regulator
MKQLIIKVGGDINKDLREAWCNPKILPIGTRTIYVRNVSEAKELLSHERLALLKECLEYSPSACVSDLVEKTGRKQEAISRDLSILESHGAIEKKKKGTKTFIEPKIDSIEIRFK